MNRWQELGLTPDEAQDEINDLTRENDALRRERDEAVAEAERTRKWALYVGYSDAERLKAEVARLKAANEAWHVRVRRGDEYLKSAEAEVARLRTLVPLAKFGLRALGGDEDSPSWIGDGPIDSADLWDAAVEHKLIEQRTDPCGDENCDACGDGDRCWRYSDAVIQARAALEGKP